MAGSLVEVAAAIGSGSLHGKVDAARCVIGTT